jgi:hypothetical protein
MMMGVWEYEHFQAADNQFLTFLCFILFVVVVIIVVFNLVIALLSRKMEEIEEAAKVLYSSTVTRRISQLQILNSSTKSSPVQTHTESRLFQTLLRALFAFGYYLGYFYMTPGCGLLFSLPGVDDQDDESYLKIALGRLLSARAIFKESDGPALDDTGKPLPAGEGHREGQKIVVDKFGRVAHDFVEDDAKCASKRFHVVKWIGNPVSNEQGRKTLQHAGEDMRIISVEETEGGVVELTGGYKFENPAVDEMGDGGVCNTLLSTHWQRVMRAVGPILCQLCILSLFCYMVAIATIYEALYTFWLLQVTYV